jgi:type IV pilus assembly protein PilP
MMPRLPFNIAGMSLVFSVWLLSGCANEEYGDLRAWMEESARNMHGKVDPLPQVKPYVPYVYAAFDLTEPFSELKLKVERPKNGVLAPNTNRPKEPLEAFDLEKLIMAGTLERANVMYALIKTPEGSMYRVKPGNYIGQNFGLITEISETEVKLKEIVEDSNGDWVERASTIVLEEHQQEQKK